MSIFTYMAVAFIWMSIIWLVARAGAQKWQSLIHVPAYWALSLGVGVLVPFCAHIYSVLSLTPVLNIEAQFLQNSTQVLSELSQSTPVNITNLALVLYGLGVLFLLFRLIWGWRRFSKQSKASVTSQYKTQTGTIDIIATELDIPPCAFGVRRSVILMPAALLKQISPKQSEMIYAHEAAHISGRDPLTMIVFLGLRALCWPHPCFHNLFKHWKFATELRADTLALTGKPKFFRERYGQLFVEVLRKNNSRGALPCPSASLNLSNYRSAKMRVTNIMNPNGKPRKRKHFRKKLAFTSAALFLGGTIGMSSVATEIKPKDTNAQPLARVAPIMPVDCVANEGKFAAKVKLKFDVSKDGRIENIRVTDSDNACFNQASIRSVEKWKYAKNTRKLKSVETMISYILSK